MTAAGIVSFKFVVDFGWRLQLFFQAVGSYQWRWAVHLVKIPDLTRNLNKRSYIIKLLPDQFLAKKHLQALQPSLVHVLRG